MLVFIFNIILDIDFERFTFIFSGKTKQIKHKILYDSKFSFYCVNIKIHKFDVWANNSTLTAVNKYRYLLCRHLNLHLLVIWIWASTLCSFYSRNNKFKRTLNSIYNARINHMGWRAPIFSHPPTPIYIHWPQLYM